MNFANKTRFLPLADVLKLLNDNPQALAFLDRTSSNAIRRLASFLLTKPVFLLPEGSPPYTPNISPGLERAFIAELRRLRVFTDAYPNMKQLQRETLFVQYLESIHPHDADLVCMLKDGVWPFDNLELTDLAAPHETAQV